MQGTILTPAVQPSLRPTPIPGQLRGTERRKAIRYQCGLETASYLLAQIENDSYPAKVRNISVTGVSLIVARRLEPEAVVGLELYNKARRFYCKVPLRAIYIMELADGQFMVGGAFTRELSANELAGLLS